MLLTKKNKTNTSFDWKSFVIAKKASVASNFPSCSPFKIDAKYLIKKVKNLCMYLKYFEL